MKFADPKNDIAFKKIFGDETKKEILISFINAILDLFGTQKEITDITIANPYQVPKLENLKDTILDIKAVDKSGAHYIIEMQIYHTKAFEKRVLYYTSKAFYLQLDKAEIYTKLKPVIFIGFLDFKLFDYTNDYLSRHRILDDKYYEQYLKDFEFYFVELPKFDRDLEEIEEINIRDKWIYFVKNAENLDFIPDKLRRPIEIEEAFEIANQLKWSREELDYYDAKGIYIADERGRIEYAREEGIEKGIEIGVEIGVEKGKIEEKRVIIKKMLLENIEISIISKITDLPIEEIEKLKN